MIRVRTADGRTRGRMELGAYYSKAVGNKIHVRGLPPGDYTVLVTHRRLMGSAQVQVTESAPATVTVKVRSMSFR